MPLSRIHGSDRIGRRDGETPQTYTAFRLSAWQGCGVRHYSQLWKNLLNLPSLQIRSIAITTTGGEHPPTDFLIALARITASKSYLF